MQHCRVWIDGAARGNPGEAGFGLHWENGNSVEAITGYIGHATNNIAEYAALIAALSYAGVKKTEHLLVHSDSQLIVRQINGEYKVKAPNLKPLFLRALKLRRAIPHFELVHVRREDNHHADQLANKAIDRRSPLPPWLDLDLATLGRSET